jgi:predicted TIM-barrel fold metal-dependent hydrolase
MDEQIAVALHKSNVFLDLSAWMIKLISETLIRETNTRLQDKVVSSSDYSSIQPDNWLADFRNLLMRAT